MSPEKYSPNGEGRCDTNESEHEAEVSGIECEMMEKRKKSATFKLPSARNFEKKNLTSARTELRNC